MPYKTIVLGLIEQQPELFERLRASKRLLPTIDSHALDLKASHEAWMIRLRESSPHSHPSQIASEAMEFALQELEEALCCASAPATDGPSLDEAMAYLRRHTPSA
jgi:hypothetical protein